MFWQILPHATACVAAHRLFLLDARQDRYFQVPPAPAEQMCGWLERNHACAPPAPVLATLVRSKIFRPGDREPTNALKERVAVPDGIATFERRQVAQPRSFRIARTVAGTWLRLRTLSLNSILSGLRTRGPLPVRGHLDATLAEAGAFERGRGAVPIARNCLLDSLALDGWLARRGLGSQLVFGITPEPFSAHCWLQTPEAILNDSFDHVSSFTPILAI
ncbi:lasso peptide biosynthesis B2 protein [Sphingomonas sp. LB-2]|uniref:lasso peptide biosynthesis B2 protein n=1 Tax=Sphingomonas caeni TaxID=2984949 RepID=UPI00222ECD88|nr:lasso peptide biosynthesis B2 protein [Sphingomonas caeni]MCW3847918.1 lasso peptide biosynthesis B2 protein [Sphingomonas caeni]